MTVILMVGTIRWLRKRCERDPFEDGNTSTDSRVTHFPDGPVDPDDNEIEADPTSPGYDKH